MISFSHLNSSLHAAGLFDCLLIAGWVLTLWNMVPEGRLLQDIGWLARRRSLEDRNSIVNMAHIKNDNAKFT